MQTPQKDMENNFIFDVPFTSGDLYVKTRKKSTK